MSDDRELDAMNTAYGALSQLTQEEQVRVLDWLAQKLDVSAPPSRASLMVGPAASNGPRIIGGGSEVSPRDFVSSKRPATDVERIACLAYYLTHMRATALFKTRDLTQLNAEAKYPKFSNAAFAVANATKQNQYLAPVGGGKKQITVRGEALVEALPERERVAEALASSPMMGRKKRKKGSALTTKKVSSSQQQ